MIGVIADDITGSNDIGVMFSKSGYIADIYSWHSFMRDQLPDKWPDVLIFDTDSRLDQATTAYQKVYRATKEMQQAGAVQFINKTCSVFRGNIGVEFDAMLDSLDEEFAIVVLGFPKNGRTTIDSVHYVYGEKLENSQFKLDPIHPMTQSNLVEILQAQTKRTVLGLKQDIIKEGYEVIKQEIHKVRENKQAHYLILDVADQEDLYEIAKAVKNEKVICGSSALAEELPKVKSKQVTKQKTAPLPKLIPGKGLFCAAGSLMPQTYKQVEYMKNTGCYVVELDTLSLIQQGVTNQLDPLISEIVKKINEGQHVVLHSSNTQDKVKKTKETAAELNWSNTEVSRFISSTIAAITSEVISQTGQHRFVIAGGDTSATVCKALGISGMRVWEEIQPGLPSCISHTHPSYLFVLKSGSFGDETFIKQAFDHLEQCNDKKTVAAE
ncbi:four-carbon acid sugar kinase family protein [Metabacillus halosaccharovorans]|uniref:four-carbon acid sugar kinase family protein n=1 Tax=Metabacillus halosaccharovorans TaxID=930124 RepID=UPI00203BDCA8|nr:four-carbon acid sugar kinase family protein [Metabacillus halosaccharovorans]MCM3443508.1 four-carbon acid sugar kinase family protein [Metabacillus halosaccharovorans]